MTFEERNIRYEYEQVLMGKRALYTITVKDDATLKRNIRIVWRYAIEDLLHWTPEEAAKYMTISLATKLHLKQLNMHLPYELQINSGVNFKKVIAFVYPKEYKYDLKADAIDMYEKACGLGKYKNERIHRWTKHIFDERNDGYEKAQILLNYVIELYLSHMTITELYRYFDESGNAFLKKCNLVSVKDRFFTSPLEYLHYSLPWEKQNNMLYYELKLKKLTKQKIAS